MKKILSFVIIAILALGLNLPTYAAFNPATAASNFNGMLLYAGNVYSTVDVASTVNGHTYKLPYKKETLCKLMQNNVNNFVVLNCANSSQGRVGDEDRVAQLINMIMDIRKENNITNMMQIWIGTKALNGNSIYSSTVTSTQEAAVAAVDSVNQSVNTYLDTVLSKLSSNARSSVVGIYLNKEELGTWQDKILVQATTSYAKNHYSKTLWSPYIWLTSSVYSNGISTYGPMFDVVCIQSSYYKDYNSARFTSVLNYIKSNPTKYGANMEIASIPLNSTAYNPYVTNFKSYRGTSPFVYYVAPGHLQSDSTIIDAIIKFYNTNAGV